MREFRRGFALAPGAQKGRMAGVPGEEGPGVSTAMDFLAEALGNPGAQLTGPAVVVGGGNVAIDAARCALRMGAAPVTMVCLEQPDEMAASVEEIEEATSEGVQDRCTVGGRPRWYAAKTGCRLL